MGMYAAASIYLGRANRLPVVEAVGEIWFWAALLAWSITAVGMMFDIGGRLSAWRNTRATG